MRPTTERAARLACSSLTLPTRQRSAAVPRRRLRTPHRHRACQPRQHQRTCLVYHRRAEDRSARKRHEHRACRAPSNQRPARRAAPTPRAARRRPAAGFRRRIAAHATAPAHRADIAWWLEFAAQWNGRSLLPPQQRKPLFEIRTDACGSGLGAVLLCLSDTPAPPRWLHGCWTATELAAAQRTLTFSMPHLELRALAIAATSWAAPLAGQRVRIRCDCDPVVQLLSPHKLSSPQPESMALVRALLFTAAQHNIDYYVTHIPGVENVLADALSRAQIGVFHATCPTAHRSPDTPLQPPCRAW